MGKPKPPPQEQLEGLGGYIDDLAQALAAAKPLWQHDDLFKEPPEEEE